MKQNDKYVGIEKKHLDSAIFSKFSSASPYQAKQEIHRTFVSQAKSAFRHGNSLIPPNGLTSLENAAKIYRMPSKREVVREETGNYVLDSDENLPRDIHEICAESSIVKPKPPSGVTLKYNSSILTKSGRLSKTVQSRTKREKRSVTEKNDEPAQKKMLDSSVVATKTYSKTDVLSSLKTLSLIEPFLETNRVQNETKCATNFQIPKSITDSKINITSENPSKANKIRNNLQHSNLSQMGPKQQKTTNFRLSGWKKTRINEVFKKNDKEVAGVSHNNTVAPKSSLTFFANSYSNDMLYLVKSNGEFESRKEDYVDTSDSESFVFRDAYNNRISVKEEMNFKPRHETPISIVASLNEPPKPPNKRQSYLTQRQLSFVGATVPTATVVDISTGSAVENEVLSPTTEETDLQQFQRLRSAAGSKAGVPSSFYYNRKIQRQKQEDRAEMIELSKLKEKARNDIKHMVSRLDSPISQKSFDISKSAAPNARTPLKRPIEYKIVRLPSPTQVVVENEHLKSADSAVDDSAASRCSSTVTSSSSSSSSYSTKHPSAPNPSPQLAPNRFQIFPTSNPNTFHAFTNSSSQPTVISMDHFCLAKTSLKKQSNDRTKLLQSTGVNRKPLNGVGVRIFASSDNRINQHKNLNHDTLVKGQSINLKNQYKSDSETDNEVETSDNNALNSSGDDSDDKKILQVPPEHAANKFFKFSNSGIKVKKLKDDNPDVVTYTPLQSLVIKSCQSVNPIVVIPEFGNETTANEQTMNSDNLLTRTQTTDGHISPLKGIRILRRKMTVRQYGNEAYRSNGKIRYKNLLSDSQKIKQSIVEELEANKLTSCDAKHFSGYIPPSVEKLDSIRAISSKYNKENYHLQPANGRLHIQQPNLVYQSMNGKIDDTFIEKSINIDKLNLGRDTAAPFLLLKEGTMQTLNFINPNAVHFSLAPFSKQDAKEIVERSAKRRRKVQLGSNIGSDDCVSVKMAAGGGFKSNVARYSLLLRQKYHKQQEEPTQKQLEHSEILEISKTGIEPLNKNDKLSQKILERNPSPESDNDTLADAETSCENINVKSPTCVFPSKSRLQIRDILDNLCANDEPTDRDSPNGIKNDRRSIDASEQDLENCRKHLSLTKSLSFMDVNATGHSSKYVL